MDRNGRGGTRHVVVRLGTWEVTIAIQVLPGADYRNFNLFLSEHDGSKLRTGDLDHTLDRRLKTGTGCSKEFQKTHRNDESGPSISPVALCGIILFWGGQPVRMIEPKVPCLLEPLLLPFSPLIPVHWSVTWVALRVSVWD